MYVCMYVCISTYYNNKPIKKPTSVTTKPNPQASDLQSQAYISCKTTTSATARVYRQSPWLFKARSSSTIPTVRILPISSKCINLFLHISVLR